MPLRAELPGDEAVLTMRKHKRIVSKAIIEDFHVVPTLGEVDIDLTTLSSFDNPQQILVDMEGGLNYGQK